MTMQELFFGRLGGVLPFCLVNAILLFAGCPLSAVELSFVVGLMK